MKIYFVDKFSEGDSHAQAEAMRQAGFEFVAIDEADAIYCASISVMQKAIVAKNLRDIPLVVYCWDYYLWAHGTTNMSGDWVEYARFLESADLILVPSKAQRLRPQELLGLDSVVILSGITTFEEPIIQGDYVLEAIRTYPEENATWTQRACDELGIKLFHTEHQIPPTEFKKLIAGCRFMVCPVREASTGGLTLVEGLWLGKPSLISNSPYMGGKDYVGKFCTTFQYDSYDDFKAKMKKMWEHTPVVDIAKARNFVEKHLSYKVMAKKLLKLFQETI